MVASLIQFKCTKYFRDDLTLVFEGRDLTLVFENHSHISEDGFEIELKPCASSKTSFKSSRKYFVHLNWIRLVTNPSWLDISIGRAAAEKPEDASSNSARGNEFFVVLCSVRQINMNLVFQGNGLA